MTDAEQFAAVLHEGLAWWELALSPAQQATLRAHYEAVVEANHTMNLTRIVDPIAAAWKHYLDSLAPLLWLRAKPATKPETKIRDVLDIGTGSGFPAVPLAVARPDWRVLAIDGTRKKIDFLAAFTKTAALTNLTAEHAHSTHFETKRTFDLITSRAVGPLEEAMRQASPLLRKGGFLVAYKTPQMEPEELKPAEAQVAPLGFAKIETFDYELHPPDEEIRRRLFVLAKRK